jgi:dihydrofolate reductase
MMRKISVVNYLTLDGVMQSPASADEDRSGGFEHGGWVVPYIDEVWGKAAGEGMAAADTFLFGRLTYEKMAAHWPNQPDDDPIAAMLNRSTKYVASNTLDEVRWENSEAFSPSSRREKKGPARTSLCWAAATCSKR